MKKYLIPLLIISLILIYLQIVASQELKYIALAIVVLIVITAVIILFFISWWSSEKMKSIKADRIEREKSAHVTVVSTNNETWIRDTGKAEWINLTGTPILRVNGEDRLPTEIELELHKQKLLAQIKSPKIIEQLPAEIEDKPESLFDLLEMYPHIMFIAGSGSGKTTQINHCIEYHLRQDKNTKVVWLSTHSSLDRNENNIHPKAVCFQQPEQIAEALSQLFETYQKRRDNAGQYSKLVICLDEWPETVFEISDWIKAGNILVRMSSGSRKTNISLILAGQGSGVIDLDTKGRSTVKLNFAEIFLSQKMTQRNKALWQSGKDRIEIDIPGIFHCYGKSQLAELPMPKSKEQQWLELVESGISKNEASLQVFNKPFSGRLVGKLNNYASSNS